ncbi:hypothetical protein BC834DRAFT_561328 [Gloeopeniophorella convolvens]|nr:hypothetical protein BC834DRAFT_561328 [Gloeopeniophorella convolvens]
MDLLDPLDIQPFLEIIPGSSVHSRSCWTHQSEASMGPYSAKLTKRKPVVFTSPSTTISRYPMSTHPIERIRQISSPLWPETSFPKERRIHCGAAGPRDARSTHERADSAGQCSPRRSSNIMQRYISRILHQSRSLFSPGRGKLEAVVAPGNSDANCGNESGLDG